VARTPRSPNMVGWVKVVGSAFEDCDLKPLPAQRTGETDHDTRLAYSTPSATDDEPRYRNEFSQFRSYALNLRF